MSHILFGYLSMNAPSLTKTATKSFQPSFCFGPIKDSVKTTAISISPSPVLQGKPAIRIKSPAIYREPVEDAIRGNVYIQNAVWFKNAQ